MKSILIFLALISVSFGWIWDKPDKPDKPRCACPYGPYFPICGYDGKNYPTICMAQCANTVRIHICQKAFLSPGQSFFRHFI